MQPFFVQLQASDQGAPGLSSEVNFTIFIDDVNDNPPVFQNSPYFAEVLENMPFGTQVDFDMFY